jgi:hypothetical protein
VPCRGYLDIDEDETPRNADGLLPDSYLYVGDWGKGLTFLNGFNLGWYWPSSGPANTMCASFCYISKKSPARANSLPLSCSLQRVLLHASPERCEHAKHAHASSCNPNEKPCSAFYLFCLVQVVRQTTHSCSARKPYQIFLSLETGFDNRKILLFRYVPGPILRLGVNEVILLEVEAAPSDPTGDPIQDYPIQLDHHL